MVEPTRSKEPSGKGNSSARASKKRSDVSAGGGGLGLAYHACGGIDTDEIGKRIDARQAPQQRSRAAPDIEDRTSPADLAADLGDRGRLDRGQKEALQQRALIVRCPAAEALDVIGRSRPVFVALVMHRQSFTPRVWPAARLQHLLGP
jgi:hypothetical protein